MWYKNIYAKTMLWSQHPHAGRYLALVSFIEASVFPIPPYFMLAPMALARPERAIFYASLATVCSVLGGVLGYWLGYFVFNPVVLPIIDFFGYTQNFGALTASLQSKGFFAVLIAGFTPVPFKLVAIGSGLMHINLGAFLSASILGRGVKFFAVALLVKIFGTKFSFYNVNKIKAT